jgi:hypothetical protein
MEWKCSASISSITSTVPPPNGVQALTGRIVREVVDAFDQHGLQFFSGIGIEDGNLAAAAPYGKALCGWSRAMATLSLPNFTGQDTTTVFFQRSTTAICPRARSSRYKRGRNMSSRSPADGIV